MFPTYEVTGPFVNIPAGRLRLDAEQAKRRAHLLKHVKGDVYQLLAPTSFKRGEVFGYDGPLPRLLTKELAETAKSPKAKSRTATYRPMPGAIPPASGRKGKGGTPTEPPTDAPTAEPEGE